jgi:hypothetical protein
VRVLRFRLSGRRPRALARLSSSSYSFLRSNLASSRNGSAASRERSWPAAAQFPESISARRRRPARFSPLRSSHRYAFDLRPTAAVRLRKLCAGDAEFAISQCCAQFATLPIASVFKMALAKMALVHVYTRAWRISSSARCGHVCTRLNPRLLFSSCGKFQRLLIAHALDVVCARVERRTSHALTVCACSL